MKANEDAISLDAALEKAGNGLYNILLVATCGLILLGIGIDMFGFSLAVAAACDLDLNVTQQGILTSLPMVGILVSSYPWGYISDTKGRRYSLIISALVGSLLSSLSSLASNWIVLGLIKFVSVCFSCAANSVTYTLLGESCIQSVRRKYMLIITCILILSPGAAAVLTYPTLLLDFKLDIPFLNLTFTPWRLLIIVLALPTGLGGIAIWFFCESPKFLANYGREDEALEVLKTIHRINHRGSKEPLKITSLVLEGSENAKHQSLWQSLHEQSAPLFRPPMLWRTLQLYFIVLVVYITNNSFLVWLPYLLNLVIQNLKTSGEYNSFCHLITLSQDTPNENTFSNSTDVPICKGKVESNVIITLVISQSIFSFLTFVISYLMKWRRIVLLTNLSIAALSGFLINLMPDPVLSIVALMVFTSTNLAMGILASYFVDLYPTSCRGMVTCLSMMVARTSAFIGINMVSTLLFNYCAITFNAWSLLVVSSIIASWFLPADGTKQIPE
ncbi:solute carrier family 22 member 5-like isoform X2 [Leptidea sinapis]|uniref:solute carrier family 22 member 5-like isoform X2 n=1 Tax=Leptidea sinapis TaxID=189913 RepID=UPI0021C2BAAF|nr:solute carrier family 22 member 5-like isoform X2 [Leptidea sinapis]